MKITIFNKEHRATGLARKLIGNRVERALQNLPKEGFNEKFYHPRRKRICRSQLP